jgi:hypothetical protein
MQSEVARALYLSMLKEAFLERCAGIEPASTPWQGAIMPIDQQRIRRLTHDDRGEILHGRRVATATDLAEP